MIFSDAYWLYMLFLLLYFILCSVIVAMRCVIVSINHYLSIYLDRGQPITFQYSYSATSPSR